MARLLSDTDAILACDSYVQLIPDHASTQVLIGLADSCGDSIWRRATRLSLV